MGFKSYYSAIITVCLVITLFLSSCTKTEDCINNEIERIDSSLKVEWNFYPDILVIFRSFGKIMDQYTSAATGPFPLRAVRDYGRQLSNLSTQLNSLEPYSPNTENFVKDLKLILDRGSSNAKELERIVLAFRENSRSNPDIGDYLNDFWGSLGEYNDYNDLNERLRKRADEIVSEFGVLDAEILQMVSRAEQIEESIRNNTVYAVSSIDCGDGFLESLFLTEENKEAGYENLEIKVRLGLKFHDQPMDIKIELQRFYDTLNLYENYMSNFN